MLVRVRVQLQLQLQHPKSVPQCRKQLSLANWRQLAAELRNRDTEKLRNREADKIEHPSIWASGYLWDAAPQRLHPEAILFGRK